MDGFNREPRNLHSIIACIFSHLPFPHLLNYETDKVAPYCLVFMYLELCYTLVDTNNAVHSNP